MKEKQNHHGDLRKALIETGIDLIGTEGEESLSLRKVAVKCGVSNAAPYAHFQNKAAFICAMQEYVFQMLVDTLEKSMIGYSDSSKAFSKLGTAFVMFFYQHPLYYDFIFSRKNIKINLSLEAQEDKIYEQPLQILKTLAISMFSKMDMPEQVIQNNIIAMWALVQGLSCIVTMPTIHYEYDWESQIENILRTFSIAYQNEKK